MVAVRDGGPLRMRRAGAQSTDLEADVGWEEGRGRKPDVPGGKSISESWVQTPDKSDSSSMDRTGSMRRATAELLRLF